MFGADKKDIKVAVKEAIVEERCDRRSCRTVGQEDLIGSGRDSGSKAGSRYNYATEGAVGLSVAADARGAGGRRSTLGRPAEGYVRHGVRDDTWAKAAAKMFGGRRAGNDEGQEAGKCVATTANIGVTLVRQRVQDDRVGSEGCSSSERADGTNVGPMDSGRRFTAQETAVQDLLARVRRAVDPARAGEPEDLSLQGDIDAQLEALSTGAQEDFLQQLEEALDRAARVLERRPKRQHLEGDEGCMRSVRARVVHDWVGSVDAGPEEDWIAADVTVSMEWIPTYVYLRNGHQDHDDTTWCEWEMASAAAGYRSANRYRVDQRVEVLVRQRERFASKCWGGGDLKRWGGGSTFRRPSRFTGSSQLDVDAPVFEPFAWT